MKINQDERKELASRVLGQFALQAYADGHLLRSDLQDAVTLRQKLNQIFKEKIKTGINFSIDHRTSILRQARYFISQKQHEYASIFHAMFFEHCINSLIIFGCRKKSISRKVGGELIRGVRNDGKYSWVLELLGLPRFNESHAKRIGVVAEYRNAFVHYKYKPISDSFIEEERRLIESIKGIEECVHYMQKYENKVLFDGDKNKLKALIR